MLGCEFLYKLSVIKKKYFLKDNDISSFLGLFVVNKNSYLLLVVFVLYIFLNFIFGYFKSEFYVF